MLNKYIYLSHIKYGNAIKIWAKSGRRQEMKLAVKNSE